MKTMFILVVFIVQAGDADVETAMYATMAECRERAALLSAVPPADMGLDALGAVCVTSPRYRESRT